MQLEEIKDFNCCRVCLGRYNLIDIFAYDGDMQIRDKVMYCATVQIIKNDQLPSKICDTCKGYVDIAYTFKTVCESTNRQLLQFIQSGNIVKDYRNSDLHPLSVVQTVIKEPRDEDSSNTSPTQTPYYGTEQTQIIENRVHSEGERSETPNSIGNSCKKPKSLLIARTQTTGSSQDRSKQTAYTITSINKSNPISVKVICEAINKHESPYYTGSEKSVSPDLLEERQIPFQQTGSAVVVEHLDNNAYEEDDHHNEEFCVSENSSVNNDPLSENSSVVDHNVVTINSTNADVNLDVVKIEKPSLPFEDEFIQEVEIEDTADLVPNVLYNSSQNLVMNQCDSTQSIKPAPESTKENKENLDDNAQCKSVTNSVGRHVAKKNKAKPHPRKVCSTDINIKEENPSSLLRDEMILYDHEIPTEDEVVISDGPRKKIHEHENSQRKSSRKHIKKRFSDYISDDDPENSPKEPAIKQELPVFPENIKSEINEKLVCNICFKEFPYNSHLIRHINTHLPEKEHECSYCHKKFRNKYNLSVHLKRHTGELKLKCKECNKGFASPSVLKRHAFKHSTELQFQCRFCDKRLAHKASLKVHEERHIKKMTYVCNICPKTFSYSSTLSSHMKLHAGIKEHKCNWCFRAFSRKTVLIRHMKSCHFKSYKCKECGFIIKRSNYVSHLKSHGIYKCIICNVDFASNDLMLTHNDQKHWEEFTCAQCNKICRGKNALDKHLRKHKSTKRLN